MPVTLLAGVEQSTDNTTNNPRDVAANVFELEPNISPLLSLTSKTNSAPAKNPKIEWIEDESMPRITTLSASVSASTVTVYGVAADIFRVGDVVRNTTRGWALLVSATGTGAISGARVGGVTQTSAASAEELYIVANANAEAASLREIKYPQLVAASNYCEIVRTPFGLTETEQATEHYGGDEEARLKAKFGKEHARALEQIAFFGARDLAGTNQRMAGGLLEFISTNSTGAGGALTEATLNTFIKQGFRYGSDRKLLFCSPIVKAAIDGFALAKKAVDSSVQTGPYGVVLESYVASSGVVDLVMHRDWFDSAVYGGYGIMVDPANFKYRPLRDTKLLMNRQAPDYDGLKHEYLTEASFQIVHERTHAKLTGVTS